MNSRFMSVSIAVAVALAARLAMAQVGIQGTMSNFDVFNDTGQNVYGAELDLDGLLSGDVTKTYPCHFQNLTMTEYNINGTIGTKLIFSGYSFPPNPAYLTPAASIFTTNGHYAVDVQGAEHFGFSTPSQATKSAFYWLDANLNRITANPLAVPQTTWAYVAPVGANPGVVQAAIVPLPPAPQQLHGDAVWVKVFVTELAAPAELDKLISYDDVNPDPAMPSIAPQLPSEVEAEWELLSDDSVADVQPLDVLIDNNQEAVVRRFEYYKYMGGYDEVHLPTSSYTGGEPNPLELGDFLMANMVAANLVAQVEVPEPATALFLLGGLGFMTLLPRRQRARRH